LITLFAEQFWSFLSSLALGVALAAILHTGQRQTVMTETR